MRQSRRTIGFFSVLTVLVSGAGLMLRAQLPQQVGTWASLGPSSDNRVSAAAVALVDGRTLIAGGLIDGTPTDAVVIYDPADGSFSNAGQLLAPRTGHTATLLEDGRILIAGGIVNDLLTGDLEIFDPTAGASTLTATMAQMRSGHAAAPLPDGTVLIAGGMGTDGVLRTAEIFDPGTGDVAMVPTPMGSPRAGASATTLIDGRVLLAGGNDGTADLATAEIYYGQSQFFQPTDTALSVPRSGHAAVLLPHNNSVLIAGGSSNGEAQASADLFLPAEFPDPYSYGMGRFAATGDMGAPRSGAVGAPDLEGYALAVGGGASDAELYRFATIKTDKDDYAPGEKAIITGSGWEPGKPVTLLFQEDPAVHDDYVLIVTARADGTIYWDQWAPEEHDLNVRFYLTAKQATPSGEKRAQITFTDASPQIAKIAFSPSTSFTVAPAVATSAMVVNTQRANGDVETVTGGGQSVTIEITSDSLTGRFDTSASGSFAVSSLTLTIGQGQNSTPSFYFKDSSAGDVALTASVTAKTNLLTNLAVGSTATRSGSVEAPTFSVTFQASPLTDVSVDTTVVSVTIGTGAVTTVTRGELPKTFTGIASGTNVFYSYFSPLSVSATKQYRWDLTSGLNQTLQSNTLTVTGTGTVTASYVAQFKRTFTQSGIGGDSTGTVVTVNAAAKTAAQLPFTDWFDSGATVTYSYADPVASTVAGKRYALTTPVSAPGSPFAVSGAATVTGTYKTQVQLTFTQSGIGADSTGTVVTVNAAAKTVADLPFTTDWLDIGASVNYSYADPVASTVAIKRYALTALASMPSSPITVTNVATITGTYKTQYELTFTQSGIAGDSTGTVVTVNAAAKMAGELPFSEWFDDGATVDYNYGDPVASTVAGKRYVLTTPALVPSSPFAVTGAATITGTYKTQYQLTFTQSGIGIDSTGPVVTVNTVAKVAGELPFNAWFDSGAEATYSYTDPVASSVAGKRYALTTPPAEPVSPITVSGAATITGTYKTQFEVTFTQSGIALDSTGPVVTVNAASKTAAQLPFSTWFDGGAAVTYSYADPVASTVVGKRYVLTTPAPTPGSPFPVTGAATVTGTYKIQVQLTFTQSGIGADSTGTVVTVNSAAKTAADLPFTTDWLDIGASVTHSYADPVASTLAGKRYALTVPAPAPSPITVTDVATITGTYKTQYELTFTQNGIAGDSTGTVVTINAAAKMAGELPFSEWFDSGAMVTYVYAAPVASTVAGKRYVLTTPAPMPASPIAVTGAATVIGTYKTQFYVTFTAIGLPIGADSVTGSHTVATVSGVPNTAAMLPLSNWYDQNATIPYAFQTPISTDPVSAVQFELTNAASLPTSPIAVTAAATITGNYSVNTYTIQYFSPLDQSSGSNYVINSGKNGRVIPVKAQIFKNGVLIGDTSTVIMKVAGSNCSTASSDLIEEYADAGASNGNTNLFRWSSPHWIYNLDTRALGLVTNACYRLDVYLNAITGPTAVRASSLTWAIFKPTK